MSRIAYVNGRFVPQMNAVTHINDRGYQFADGVYEVIAFVNGRFADEKGHLDRLARSLNELHIDMPVKRQALKFLMRELLRRNRYKNAAVYIQVTRGIAKRDFKFPANIKPCLVMSCWPYKFDTNPALETGIKAVTVEDQRWARRDIKTIALLPQALAKQKAHEKGAYEALMVNQDGFITEGSSSNFWLYKDGALKTTPSSYEILKGVTRTAIYQIAKDEKIEIVEEHITPEEAYRADEAFCTSATGLLVPVVDIDGNIIGSGKPGELARKIYNLYRQYADKGEGDQLEWTA